MTENQKRLRALLDRQSKERQRMAEIAKLESLTPEIRTELKTIEDGTPDLEMQIRAARTAVAADDEASQTGTDQNDAGDAETRERLELRNRCNVGAYVSAMLAGRSVTGAEAEYMQAAGIASGIPLDLWERDRPQPERRADAPTGAPSTVGVNLQPIQPYLFARAVLPRLGVAMPSAESGTYASATISAQAAGAAAAKAKDGVIESVEPTLTVTSATPKRVSARLSLRLEDIAAVGQENFEAALRDNMSMALSAELDNQGINGNGTAPNLSGILTRLSSYANTASTNKDTFATYHAIIAALIDGNWSETMGDLALCVGPLSMQNMVSTFATNDDSVSAYQSLMAKLQGLFTSSRMPDAASNVQDAIAVRMAHSVTKAVCPHWGRVEIDDIYTDSAKGIRHFTAHVILGDVILVQPSAYQKLRFKTA